MRKPLTLISCIAFVAFLFLFQTPISSCNKTTTVTDTVIKTVRDTTIKTVTDTVVLKDTIPHINLNDGLIAYYPFSGNAGDSSVNHNNGTVYGNLQYTTDVNNHPGAAALFDGATSYILVNDNGSLSTASITISAQFYATSTAHQNLVSKINYSNPGATSPVWAISPFGASTNTVSFAALGPSVSCGSPEPIAVDQVVSSNSLILPNHWYQLTCIFDAGVEKLYVNGVLEGAEPRDYTTLKQCTDAQLVIGAWFVGSPLFFNGKIDELRIYNRALNDREIQALAKGF